MESKTNIYQLWIQYTTQSDENYFWKFVAGFVEIWENQCGVDFQDPPPCSEAKSDGAPALAKLPDELLAAIGKFLYISKEKLDRAEAREARDLEEINLLLRCLFIICRNFDNIPLIASCDYVALTEPIAAECVNILNTSENLDADGSRALQSIVLYFCHFLEGMYDPYLTWRNHLMNRRVDFSKLAFKPSLLHVEVVPFIYDCFETDSIFKYPLLCVELLNVFGSTISGAQSMLSQTNGDLRRGESTRGNGHNALRSVCPATVCLIIRIISSIGIDRAVRDRALNCFTVMVQVLHKSTPEQRQIELSLILEMYTDSLKKLISENLVKSDISNKLENDVENKSISVNEELHTLSENIAVIDSIDCKKNEELSYMICSALETIRRLLEDFENSRVALCQLMVDLNFINILILLPDSLKELDLDKQLLGIECVKTLTCLLSFSKTAKRKFSTQCDYDLIVTKWTSLDQPSKELLQEFIYMAMDGDRDNNVDIPLCNPEVVMALLKNMDKVKDDDQAWLVHKLSWLCTKDLRSKWLACKKGAISSICDVLIDFDKTVVKPVITLINLLDNLACVSISACELKKLFFLLRHEKEFAHKIALLHTLCNITRKSDNVCKAFLNIQNETDGISVPNINKWNNTSYGFTFHCWMCLDRLSDTHEAYGKHRQLLHLLTQSGQGLEIYIDQAGALFINILKKNSTQTTSVPSAGLNDSRWHCISVSIAYARRALSNSQISVFIDGTQRLAVSMKFQSFDDVFSYCYIGAPLSEHVKQSQKKMETEKESFPSTIVKSIFSNQFLPALVQQAPSYLSFGTNSKSGQTNPASSSHTILNQVPLHGHISHVSLFNDALTLSVAKWLHESGSDCHNILSGEEGADSQEMLNRFVFCFSALATWDGTCMNLALSPVFNGITSALRVYTTHVKDVINAISNVYALFPLLEESDVAEESNLDLEVFCSPSSPLTDFDTQAMKEWEILPTNSNSEWKLDQNTISMFLTLLKNIILSNNLNQDELVKNEGLVIVGLLLSQCKPSLIDVNVLMAAQQLIESVRDLLNTTLMSALYQNILFNFKIWSRSAFHIRIAHIQYITNFIKSDKNYFRKNFGLQLFFDVIRTYYSSDNTLSADDSKTVRLALLGIVKFFISKDINIKELLTILGFLVSTKEELLLIETLEMLIMQMESRSCRDQIFLLLHEQYTGEILYVLLLSKVFSDEFKVVLARFLHIVLRTNRVHLRNKTTMLLQDGHISMYPGLIGFMDPKNITFNLASLLFDVMTTGETKGGYTGIISLLHIVSYESIDIKMELAKKLLTSTFVNLNAPYIIAKQVGWQDGIARLLVKRCISDITVEIEEAVDLMTFDEESLKLEPDTSYHHTNIPSLSEAANVIEHEIKEIAGSVSEAVADNLQYAADNLTTAVASVCSVIRQKTVDFQESLGELGHISRSNLPSFAEHDSIEFNIDNESIAKSSRSVSSLSMDDDPATSETSSQKHSLDCDISKQPKEVFLPHDLDLDNKSIDKEENLSYLVANILFTILWRGVEGFSKESWKERGQVMASINLLALNNELYCSHLQLRLRLLEMGVQAAMVDLKEPGMSIQGAKLNALHLMRLIYDLVVLDPNKDDTKKCSSKLLDGVLALLDALKVFTEEDNDAVHQELARLGLGVLVVCATSIGTRASLAAPACALLHSLLRGAQISISGDPEMESAHLICSISSSMKSSIEVDNNEQYSFLMPVMKALLEKVWLSMNVEKYLIDLPNMNTGPVFFNNFEKYIQSEQWNNFIEFKVRPLSIAYDRETSRIIGEPLNTFWAECYEACKAGAQARARDQMHAKGLFQSHVVASFRTRQSEDLQRYNSTQTIQRGKLSKAAAIWKTKRAFLRGPRGAWASGKETAKFWRLSPHENLSRMRLKLDVSCDEDARPEILTVAARLRDNLGRANSNSAPNGSMRPFAPPRVPRADDDFFVDEDIKLSLEPEPQTFESGKEKMVVSQECELITLMTKVKGRLDVTTSSIYFHDLSPIKEDGERQDFVLSLSQLREIHLRRYNLRRSALEIFLVDQTNYFLNFTTKARNGVFSRILGLQPPNILYGSGQSPAELLKASGLTQKWMNREITNFDYIMHLNTIAGRTYNDLSQYPVYPWILADYHSDVLDLENPESYRDLTKPVGVVNPKNEAEVRAKYENFEDPTGVISKFHYGTHYSNSAGVLHYLLRIEPFTSLHIELQSGRFDVADRQFHSISQTWKMLMNNPNDVKELTPEFFYLPEFLKNINDLDLGVLQGTNIKVGDVVLPPWAEGDAENFIYLHRKALESDYVSENLNHWIDLIFGYKQRGPRAVDALNVFYYCSYEGAVDLDAIADPGERAAVEGMIANFGQVPAQLIRSSPHPARLTAKRAAARALRGEIRTLHCLHLLSHLTIYSVQISRTDEPIIWLGGPCRGRGFLQGGGRWLIAMGRSGLLHTPVWQPFSPNGQPLEPESSGGTLKTRRQVTVVGENGSGINNKAIAMSSDGKILYTGGHWDSSIRVYSISSKVKLLGLVSRHFGPVTCLALDACSEQWLVSGSTDSTVGVWDVGTNPGSPHLKNFLYGHDGPVTCVAVMAEMDIVVSGSKDGTVNVYTLKKGEYIHTLYPRGCQGTDISVKYIVLSHQGNITFIVNDQIYHSVHVFNINGFWKASRNVCGRVTALNSIGDCLLIADDAGDITISTSHSLKPVYDVPLHVPIEHVLITPHNTHILVAMRDGKVSIIGLPPPNRSSHSLIDTV